MGAFYEDITTFSPVLAFGGASVGITYSTQSGYYARTGNMVFLQIDIALSNKGSSTGVATITGHPYMTVSPQVLMAKVQNLTLDAGNTYVWALNSSSTINIEEGGSGVASTATSDTNLTNTTIITISGVYFISGF